ncbi:MAG: GNAT family N-acetyltransferase [Verrucomicrobiaceae bacterium]
MTTPDHLINNSLGLWWKDVPTLPDHTIGCLGIPQSATDLADAEDHLRAQGCTLAIGPMEGNTWRTHRAVIESDGRPPFLLEPITPPETASLFESAGYQTLARYSSSLLDLTVPPPDLTRLENRLHHVSIRTLDLDNLESDLKKIFALSLQTFTQNFLYTPITESEFLQSYLAFAQHLTPESAFLAESEDDLVGFVFGFSQAPTFIVKTLAVLPERRFAGLGTLLVERIQNAARQHNHTEAIHALQREDNQSLRISSRFHAHVFRRYALFSRTL